MKHPLIVAVSLLSLLLLSCGDTIEPTHVSAISPTPAPPGPTEHTLSGVIFEATAQSGNVPRAGVFVQCELCAIDGGTAEVRTDSSGVYFFTFTGPGTGTTILYVGLDGYRVIGGTEAEGGGFLVEIPLNGDTRKDIEIARR